jgi:glycosyltransferase involved in cell wall biosynthesis
MPQYHFDVLSLGYKGLPIELADNVRVLELEKAIQCPYYFKKLNPDITIIFHSFYMVKTFAEGGGQTQMMGKKILYIPLEGDEVPMEYRKYLPFFDKIITPSEFSRKGLKRTGVEATVVPHGVDSTYFCPPTERQWKEFRFSYLGMNDIRKQVPKVMEAYARLGKGILSIASENEGHYNLISYSKELGISPVFVEQKALGLSMSREAIRGFLQNCDVYISPGSESYGLPGLEAQACGVPVIASEHGASKEVLGNGALYCSIADYLQTTVGKVGLISSADLYRKMRFLFDIKTARDRLARNALENAKKHTWDLAVKELEKAIESV